MSHDLALATGAVYEEFRKLQDQQSKQLSQFKFEDVSSRFEVWANNNGAMRNDRLSLQWRVRKVKILQDMLYDRLTDLQEDLRLLHDTLLANDDIDDDDAIFECEQLLAAVREDVTALFKLSAVAKRATLRDPYINALARVGAEQVKSLENEAGDIGDRFTRLRQPHLRWLRDRLAEANGRRRRFLLHKERRQEKVAAPVVKELVTVPEQALNTGYVVDWADARSEFSNGFSVATSVDLTSFAKALPHIDDDTESQASFRSYATNLDDQVFAVRQLDEISGGHEAFICPYCREEQKIKSQYVWERHVYADLRTYVCTHQDCNISMFSTSRAWLQHQVDEHSIGNTVAVTNCQFCDWSAKLAPRHVYESAELPGASIQGDTDDLDTRYDHTSRGSTVPKQVSAERYRRHLALHLEQVALLTIDHDQLPEDDHSETSDAEQLDETPPSRIELIEQWLAAPGPVDFRFFQQIMSPERSSVLDHPKITRWLRGTTTTLLLHDLDVADRVVLMQQIIDQLEAGVRARAIEYSFARRTGPSSPRSYSANAMRSMLAQAHSLQPDAKILQNLYTACGHGTMQPDFTQLRSCLLEACSSGVSLVAVDALDECSNPYVLLSFLSDVRLMSRHKRILITSRPQLDLKAAALHWIPEDCILDLIESSAAESVGAANDDLSSKAYLAKHDTAGEDARAANASTDSPFMTISSYLSTLSREWMDKATNDDSANAPDKAPAAAKSPGDSIVQVPLTADLVTTGMYIRGDCREAATLALRIVQDHIAQFGEESPEALRSMTQLAYFYTCVPEWQEAESWLQKVLLIRSKILGQRHPETLKLMDLLALVYGSAGRPEKGIALHADLRQHCIEVFGEWHIRTLANTFMLAQAYLNQHDKNRADVFMTRCKGILRVLLGYDNGDLMGSPEWGQALVDDRYSLYMSDAPYGNSKTLEELVASAIL